MYVVVLMCVLVVAWEMYVVVLMCVLIVPWEMYVVVLMRVLVVLQFSGYSYSASCLESAQVPEIRRSSKQHQTVEDRAGQ
jgi:hypothetical protein